MQKYLAMSESLLQNFYKDLHNSHILKSEYIFEKDRFSHQ